MREGRVREEQVRDGQVRDEQVRDEQVRDEQVREVRWAESLAAAWVAPGRGAPLARSRVSRGACISRRARVGLPGDRTRAAASDSGDARQLEPRADGATGFAWCECRASVWPSPPNVAAAWRSRTPLLRLVHPSSRTVETTWLVSSPASGRGNDSSSRMRTAGQQVPGNLEGSHGLITRHRWKVIEKPFQRIASSEIVDEVLDWHPGACEHRRSSQHVGITPNNGVQGWYGHDEPSLPC